MVYHPRTATLFLLFGTQIILRRGFKVNSFEDQVSHQRRGGSTVSMQLGYQWEYLRQDGFHNMGQNTFEMTFQSTELSSCNCEILVMDF